MTKYLAEAPWINAIRFKKGENFSKEIHCFLPEKPNTYPEDTRNQEWNYVKGALKELIERGFTSLSSPLWPLRLPSGGCLDIITDSTGKVFIPIEQRDDNPKIRAPGFQNPWLGYPESLSDCIFANHVKREANEEALFSRRVAVVSKKPNTEGLYVCHETLLLPSEELERKTALETAEKLGLNFPKENLSTKYDDEAIRDTFSLYRERELEAEIKCSFTWYPTPDLIQIRRVFLPVTIDEILIYHEAGRDILVVAEGDIKGKYFGDTIEAIRMTTDKNGRRIANEDKVTFKPTSSLKGSLNQIGIYPKDWVGELFELLSSEDFQELLTGNPEKDPFTLEDILWKQKKHP